MQTSDFLTNAQFLAKLNNKEKIKEYSLAPDRADVIDHALKIYIEISNLLKIKNIKSTKWGVSDSIAVKTFHELYSKKITISRS
jgi:exopolyphosphatase/guanosine-5'-triphosphate,3'-diphosphate pyrophosphatase